MDVPGCPDVSASLTLSLGAVAFGLTMDMVNVWLTKGASDTAGKRRTEGQSVNRCAMDTACAGRKVSPSFHCN